MMTRWGHLMRLIPSLILAPGVMLVSPALCVQAATPGSRAVSQQAAPCGATAADAITCARQLFISTSSTFLRDRDKHEAAAGYLEVVQLDPKYGPAWFNLGVLAEANQKWFEAKRYFEKYLEVSPHGPESKRATQEIAILTPYVAGKVSPSQATRAEYDASIQRSRIFMASNLYREAISEAGHAQSLNDSRWEAYAVAALCMKKQGKLDEANAMEKLAEDRIPVEKRDQLKRAFGSN